MILSASRRTDIPCCYPDWFMNRIKAGYVLTRNPMNRAQISRIPLTPRVVDCIVFWTKDAENLMPYLDVLDSSGYRYGFQFTITPYGRTLEPNLRDKDNIEANFIELSKRIGGKRIIWRYDPIILNDAIDMSFHKVQFARLCDKLADYTETVTVSFVDLYAKLKTPLIREISLDEIAELSEFIGDTAKAHGLRAAACCEKADLMPYGIERAACIGKEILEEICGFSLDVKHDKNQRPGCGCAESIDIGVYDTCPNGCVYCYANRNGKAAEGRYHAHRSDAVSLDGTVSAGDKITDRKVSSNRTDQTAFRID